MGQYFYIEDEYLDTFEEFRAIFREECNYHINYLITDKQKMPKSCKECLFTSYNYKDDDFTDCAFAIGKVLEVGKHIQCPLKLKEK